MTTISVLNKEGQGVGEIELNEAIFARQVNEPLMHQAVLINLASQRQGNHESKTRSFVSGGGKKPWRQKGTGHARVGSSRNPVWRGGGVAFGPHQRSHSFSMPKKMRRAALLSALSLKAADQEIVVLDQLAFDAPKTKEMVQILKNIQAENALLIVERDNVNTLLSGRNLTTVTPATVNGINVYNILLHKKLVFTKEALVQLEEVLVNA